MTTTDNSRADALTRCPLLVDADCLYGPYGMNGETVCKFCGFAKDAARPVEQHEAAPSDDAMAISDAMRMDDEGRINEQCPSRCQHPSWKSIGSDQDQCEICGAVGSERRYLAVQPESSSVVDEASDCGCATNEACKMKTDGSCWRAD
ncbi:hypothetical protein [Burkholderia sp. B21-007]|uniref:hypothetical protein n=1 Tax=Burkholderia sp. B21-007 TaxID=2890407 RepID=UPI001E46CBD0|nr:hypothetical protein [Burkholderia sp. B21-007]UEP31577.1 hypothetical protein LMA01_20430 [Burkholderia sp. B21-007]